MSIVVTTRAIGERNWNQLNSGKKQLEIYSHEWGAGMEHWWTELDQEDTSREGWAIPAEATNRTLAEGRPGW